jgi:hypothetical protein
MAQTNNKAHEQVLFNKEWNDKARSMGSDLRIGGPASDPTVWRLKEKTDDGETWESITSQTFFEELKPNQELYHLYFGIKEK